MSRARLPLVLLLGWLAAAAPSTAEVVGVNGNGFHIRVSTELPVGRDRAWEQFVHPERWWNAEHSWFGKRANFSLTPIAGGCLCESQGDSSVQHLTVATVIAGERMVLLGGLGPLQAMGLDGAASFSFEEVAPERTRVIHDYRVSGYSESSFEPLAQAVAGVQQLQLDALARSLAAVND